MQDKLEPQGYIDELRKGNYIAAAMGLGQELHDRYQKFSTEPLDGDVMIPLMTTLLAETNIAIEDMPMIQHGILSTGMGEQAGYMTHVLSATLKLLSHEAWLKEQEGNQEKSPQDIRKMVRNEVTELLETNDNKVNKIKKIEEIADGKEKKETEALIAKEMTYQKTFAYAVEHLIKENNALIRETGNLLIKRLNEVEAEIEKLEGEKGSLDATSISLRIQLKKLNADRDKLDKKQFIIQENELHEKITLLEQLEKSRFLKLNLEDDLARLITQPKEFNASKALSWISNEKTLQEARQKVESYLGFLNSNPIDESENNLDLLKAYDARKYAAAMMLTAIKTASLRSPEATLTLLNDNAKIIEENLPGKEGGDLVGWFSDGDSKEDLQEVQQKIASYLTFLDQNVVENPDENPKLLKAYEARKDAAETMLMVVKTASLRSPEATLTLLKDNAKTIEKNLPGPWELGIIAWIIDRFINKSEMRKTTDDTLMSTKAQIKTLGTKNSFMQSKKMLEEIKGNGEEHKGPGSTIP
ncbi:hypothetical protein [Fluoribacter gormanii]|uniref:Uncharacterized protein n=1 Tax=Fluoribacter gormanii TaxID=464 RepID=A0A377GFV8_9GAMM|nr:hypothetical protein [Fluoribacter gormanii]KTD02925.1 hypothetical protein Lgor_1590 [Fluoribacter gormanii]SIR85410.1 hypothetical protein SAMN05421777_13013 [Fluoribacter gormanii]STO23709.1 Uncharacterised protein [Fluoribacter gormanii]